MQKPTFEALGISPDILKAISALGFEEPSPIQAEAIPVLMAGRDAIGQSQTGSGKTAAFAIPAIERCDAGSRAVQILVLCPTRELATQVAEEFHKLSAFKRGIHAVPIYGGASYDRQFFELKKGVQIVIGTPGRLIDHIERGTLRLDAVQMVILDETDRMLDMGFREDIERILSATPDERQTVFFSATVSKQIREIIETHSSEPVSIQIKQKELTVPTVEQWYYETPQRVKVESLLRLLDYHGFKLGIIFCNTQRMVDELADSLAAQGFSVDRLHGGISQAQRTRVMNKFKKAEFEFLVATDVAGRGIDVDDLELVVNYDLPYDAEDYVHRIGRTGRAGRRGMAVSLVSGRDIYKIQVIEKFTRTKVQRGSLPTAGEVEERKNDALIDRVREALSKNEHQGCSRYVDMLLEEGYNSTDLAAALIHLLGVQTSAPAKVAEEELGRTKNRSRDVAETNLLHPPARGKQWVSVSVGKSAGAGARDILWLLEEALGIPGRAVGLIDIRQTHTNAQVPQEFLNILRDGPRTIETNAGDVKIGLAQDNDSRQRSVTRKRQEHPQQDWREKNKPGRRGRREGY